MVSFIGGGSSAPKTVLDETTELSGFWSVIVLNDPVNLMSYVSMIFKRVLGMSTSKAEKHMREVHELGRSVVWIGEREKAETYLYQLHEWHLNAILEKNEST
jgi:ATP-dependent Clp protease adaptor protein ClpS